MNAKQFIAKLSEEKGVVVTVAAVRHHARLGRIGYRHDGRWVFETEDLERMMEYAGKQGPRKGLVIRELVWEEITWTSTTGEQNKHYSSLLLGCIVCTVGERVVSGWDWDIGAPRCRSISGQCPTAEQAKTACENAWHELLMRDVLEVSR